MRGREREGKKKRDNERNSVKKSVEREKKK
jgi:hypothetical protein